MKDNQTGATAMPGDVNKGKGELMKTDSERLDWLEKQEGCGLVSDDAGHWAVSGMGMQNVPDDPPQDIQTTFFVMKDEWKKTIREAIDAAMEQEHGDER